MKKDINEVYFLRCIACLSVVLLHSISSAYRITDLVDAEIKPWFRSFQLLLCFCTPTFVLISEFLISHSYPHRLPRSFYSKRVKSILFPYIFIGIAYTAFQYWDGNRQLDFKSFLTNAGKTVFLGAFYGYFVLIIFQFYLIHPLFQRYIYNRFSIKQVLLVSFLISFFYQAAFAVFYIPYESLYSRILFPGWLVYFTVGFYAGKNYSWIKLNLNKYSKYFLPLLGLCAVFLLFNYNIVGYTPVHSKRPDLIIYTIFMAAAIFCLAARIERMPAPIIVISGYSYGIYLLHPFFFRLFELTLPTFFHSSTFTFGYIIFAFVAAVAGSMGLIFLLNQNRYGQFFVGRINIRSAKHEKEIELTDDAITSPRTSRGS